MSNVYRNQKSGLITATGKIKSFSEDRMTLVMETEEYSRGESKRIPAEFTIASGIPFNEDYKVGYTVTAVGYPHGKGIISADSVLVGNDVYESQDLAIVTGFVKFARLNEEKNLDGTPKMKQDGTTPRKPHYDVTISVNEGDKFVDHVIKVYAGNVEAGKKSPIDRMAACFKNLDAKNNRIRATFVTQPGQLYTYTNNKDGKEYVNHVCSHMGFSSFDIEYVDAEKTKTQSAPVQNQPAQTPAQTSPVQENPTQNGFTAPDLSMDEDEMFK